MKLLLFVTQVCYDLERSLLTLHHYEGVHQIWRKTTGKTSVHGEKLQMKS